jgi:hypothetical protein
VETTPVLSVVSRLLVGRPRHCDRQPVEVGVIDGPQPAPLRLLVDRNLAHAVADAHLASRNCHCHALSDQPPRHRVAVRVDLDGAIVADDAGQFAQQPERRPCEYSSPLHFGA